MTGTAFAILTMFKFDHSDETCVYLDNDHDYNQNKDDMIWLVNSCDHFASQTIENLNS